MSVVLGLFGKSAASSRQRCRRHLGSASRISSVMESVSSPATRSGPPAAAASWAPTMRLRLSPLATTTASAQSKAAREIAIDRARMHRCRRSSGRSIGFCSQAGSRWSSWWFRSSVTEPEGFWIGSIDCGASQCARDDHQADDQQSRLATLPGLIAGQGKAGQSEASDCLGRCRVLYFTIASTAPTATVSPGCTRRSTTSPARRGAHLVLHLHRLEDADRLVRFDLVTGPT